MTENKEVKQKEMSPQVAELLLQTVNQSNYTGELSELVTEAKKFLADVLD